MKKQEPYNSFYGWGPAGRADRQQAIMEGAARANRHVRTHHEQGRMCASCYMDDWECTCAVPDTRVYWLPTCWRCEPVE